MNSATKTRILTALCLLPLVLIAIFLLPTIYFNLCIAFVLLLAAKEWASLNEMTLAQSIIFIVTCTLVFMSLVFLLSQFGRALLLAGVVLWLVLPLYLYLYEKARITVQVDLFVAFSLGLLILVCGFYALVFLQNTAGSIWLFTLLLLIWIADTAAYFSGRKWGKNKLAPRLSPGKSWEGVLGALLACLLFVLIAIIWFDIQGNERIIFIITSLLVVVFSVLGDLFESMIKRLNNKKDSGTMLPGHGGILDRIDSLLSSAPFFALGISIMQVNTL